MKTAYFPRDGAPRREHGFTLVELLVGLSLLGLLSILLFGGLHFGARAWEAGASRVEAMSSVEQAYNLLRQQLAEAEPPVAVITGLSRSSIGLNGSSSALSFIAPLPAHHGTGGLYLFNLGLAQKSGHNDLVLGWRLFRPDMDLAVRPAGKDEIVLIREIGSFALAYFGRTSADAPAAWFSSWDDELGLPELIRIRVVAANGGDAWPDLLVSPRRR